MTAQVFPHEEGIIQVFEVYVEVKGSSTNECEATVQQWLDLAPESIVLTATSGFSED